MKAGLVGRSRPLRLVLWIVAWTLASAKVPSDISVQKVEQEVQHRLLTLPFYTVFDYLSFRMVHGMVTLTGRVTRPLLKDDAEKAVRQIEGVARVDNRIEVLPLSAADGRMRLAEYLAIYGDEGLNQYAIRSVPPIHIIVKNGNVTLEGKVDSSDDKTLAFSQASSVPGVQSLTDHLQTEH